jgi:hypothetical protein
MSMTKMGPVTYTIRRAAGGCSHFARVTVSTNAEHSVLTTGDVSTDWIAAAEAGVRFALEEMKLESHVIVVDIQGTLADTRKDTVFVASALATLRLMGDSSHTESFDGSTWDVSKV